jgi:large subunit ribosomal protein L21
MMYAVVRTGGKQVKVAPGDSVRVEKLEGSVGDSIEFSEVLLIGDEGDLKVGRPLVDGALVTGKITAQARGPKLRIFKMKRRTGYRRKYGHRQSYTEVLVGEIQG